MSHQFNLEELFAIVPYDQKTLDRICSNAWDSKMQMARLRTIWAAEMEQVYRHLAVPAMLEFESVYAGFHMALLQVSVTNNGQEHVFKHAALMDAAIRKFQADSSAE